VCGNNGKGGSASLYTASEEQRGILSKENTRNSIARRARIRNTCQRARRKVHVCEVKEGDQDEAKYLNLQEVKKYSGKKETIKIEVQGKQEVQTRTHEKECKCARKARCA
jgi:hypothetical protein